MSLKCEMAWKNGISPWTVQAFIKDGEKLKKNTASDATVPQRKLIWTADCEKAGKAAYKNCLLTWQSKPQLTAQCDAPKILSVPVWNYAI
jgi:hypothetical protein